ncbi:MAG: 3-oxoacyl-[acyl-carrier-protein] synthase 3 [Candidatus Anoxychlamydiales bacterium]|nr:3-oxoacyl-[acyl-carrier-protein] synthase 3 [Candidatus Anoxychlamydiales bacterium]
MDKAKIIGTGKYFPKKVLTNEDLEKKLDTSDEWIRTRTGIKERRIAGANEYTSDMGYKAALEAIEDAKISKDEIDFILVATLTPDYIFPSTACLIQAKLDIKNTAALDIQAACSGYIYALSLAKALIEQNQYKNILIIASEKLSSIVNYEDRTTAILFGDAATACIVSKQKKGYEIESVYLGSDGKEANLLIQPAGGSRNPATHETVEKKMHYIQMSGRDVFKHAVRRMIEASEKALSMANLKASDISWLIPHQANLRIIDAIAKRFTHLDKEKIFKEVVYKFGNTSASSVGIALDMLKKENKIKTNENILLTAFGAGFTFGSAVLRKIG